MSISIQSGTPESVTPAASSVREAVAGPPPAKTVRSRVFTKYVALFVAVVAVALLSNGIFEVFFYYREHKTSLIRIQHEQAEAAAAKIGQFIKEIESQLGWTTLLPWSAARESGAERIEAIYTYGHPTVGPDLLTRLPGVRVISNFGVGVHHIDLAAADEGAICQDTGMPTFEVKTPVGANQIVMKKQIREAIA